jgi:hypothetical protein
MGLALGAPCPSDDTSERGDHHDAAYGRRIPVREAQHLQQKQGVAGSVSPVTVAENSH